MEPRPLRILFVCTGNAGRSQIAQAIVRARWGRGAQVESAGVEPWDHLHPMALQVMAERGLDCAGQHPKHVRSVMDRPFDVVVTIGTPARTLLPSSLPGSPRIVHWDIDDPADADGTPDVAAMFRRAANAIEARLHALGAELGL